MSQLLSAPAPRRGLSALTATLLFGLAPLAWGQSLWLDDAGRPGAAARQAVQWLAHADRDGLRSGPLLIPNLARLGLAQACEASTGRPLAGVSKPAMRRSSVVLPEPEGPRSAISSPERISSDTSFSAGYRSNSLRMFFTLTSIEGVPFNACDRPRFPRRSEVRGPF